MLDTTAKSYGKFPHQVLALTPFEFGLALQCLDAGQAAADRRCAQINAAGGMVFPAIVLGGV